MLSRVVSLKMLLCGVLRSFITEIRLCLATEQKTTLRLKALPDVGFSPRF